MRFILSIFLLLFVTGTSIAQSGGIRGVAKDVVTGEPLIGAVITTNTGKNTVTDLDGNYSLKLEPGEYDIKISYVGYPAIERKLTVASVMLNIDFNMETTTLNEVQVVSDLAIARKTPVAFSNISTQKIQEQLGTQDLPLLLNTTPGVYATQQGGGDGDARVSIRGFNSQNVLVLIDGIPMNDMVNGRVFWTNWFGLDNLTKGIQVQRGLGASKLAIPALGGTMNILTAGIENTKQVIIKEEIGNNFNFRSTISASSGRLKGGWGVTGALSYRRNDGWVDQLGSRMFFYYFKVDKLLGAHTLTLSAMGAPQTSAQRSFRDPQRISIYSREEAFNLGIDTTQNSDRIERGRRYNPSWGYLRRTRDNPNGAPQEVVNTSENQFHKPIFSLRDFWTVNDKVYISNIIYASYGRGGGTQPQNNLTNTTPGLNGEQNLQAVYDANAFSPLNQNILPEHPDWRRSTNYLRKNHNEHNWFGTLSTINYSPTKELEISGGFDLRTYQGQVFSRVYDLLGGDFIQTNINPNEEPNAIKKDGDLIVQNIHRFVRWGGAFVTAEYKTEKFTAFVNLSGSYSAYRQVNYFLKKQLAVGDTILDIGYSDTIVYQGVAYDRNSPGLDWNKTDWKYLNGFVTKGGFNYNLNDYMNAFVNIGYFSRAPLIGNVFRVDNREFKNLKNEEITSFELGYAFKSTMFAANLNAYYTIWDNRPTRANFTVDGEPVSANAEGMQAIHKGVELDFIFKPFTFLSLEGMASIGDWRWNKAATATILSEDGEILAETRFDPTGVKVGDAAQHVYSASLRIEPVKRLYIRPQYNYFMHNYANFTPEDLLITDLERNWGPNIGRQSWRMPDYGIFDLHLGWGFIRNKVKYDFRGSVLNVLDSFFITDAQNNGSSGGTFNANSATVWVGLGRRWTTSVAITF
jgi:iron complex outermembrane recepter protein